MDVVVGAEAEGARRATGDSGPMPTSRATAPDPEVPAKVTRRRVRALLHGAARQAGQGGLRSRS